jgi:glycosyltransferase involved in cell wall biosynthesis
MPKASIVMASFKRPELLKLSLNSYVAQSEQDFEIIVVDDNINYDGTIDVVDDISSKLNIKYYNTNRELTDTDWRCPSKAINLGIKKANSNFIIISCPEIYHLNNDNIKDYCHRFTDSQKNKQSHLIYPNVSYDDNGDFIYNLNYNTKPNIKNILNKLPKLNAQLPFFMGIPKYSLLNIGGYDEDFINGIGYDDNDVVDRLLITNNKFQQSSKAEIIHLFHQRLNYSDPVILSKVNMNKVLYETRKGIPTRNIGKDWGAQDE